MDAATNAQQMWILSQVRVPTRRPGEAPMVSYAHSGFPKPLSGPDVLVNGGAVKYHYLDRRLPHAALRFNIVYVVSSSHCANLDSLIQIAQNREAKVVWNQNGVYHPQSYADASNLNVWMANLYRRVDYVFYQSKFCLNSARLFLGERTGPGEILHNAVDTKFFVPVSARKQGNRQLRLLMAGSNYWTYRLFCGIRTLAAVRRTRPARLVIAGIVTEKVKLESRKLITDLGLEYYVDFLGPYRQTKAPNVYQQGDIYLHTKYIDPCPSAVIEAMACGLPVVYSKTGGTAELVGEEGGIGVPTELSWDRNIPPNPEHLATCVLQVADALPQYSEAARERAVANFDLEPWLDRHVQVFKMLME